MDNNVTVLVSGLGRCGTSMMMRMLDVGGMPVFADNRASYEARSLNGMEPVRDSWIEMRGKASKLLDPHKHFGWPTRLEMGRVKIIYMIRDKRQQAKSQCKMTQMLLAGSKFVSSQEWRAFYRALKGGEDLVAMAKCREIGEVRVFSFDEILSYPITSAIGLQSFLGDLLPNWTLMPAEVLVRSPLCQPGFDIELAAVERDTKSVDSLTARY